MNCVPAQMAMSVFLNVMSLEVVVVGGLDVEQVEVAAAVDDHLAVARGLDHDRLLGRAVGGEVIRALERRRRVDGGLVGVELVAIRVGAGVHQDGVARLHARPSARRGVAGAAVVVVGAHDAGERRLGLRCRCSRPDRRGTPCPPAAGIGSGRVRTVTVFVAFAAGPLTPSGSLSTKRASYAVSGSRSRMLPANMFGETSANTFGCVTRSPCRRSSGMPVFHAAVARPCGTTPPPSRCGWHRRRCSHSKPRLISVGGSTMNSPGVTRRAGGLLGRSRRCRAEWRGTRW